MKPPKKKPLPCTCKAYSFPHRLGGGDCFGPCPGCGAGSRREEMIYVKNTYTHSRLICDQCGTTED